MLGVIAKKATEEKDLIAENAEVIENVGMATEKIEGAAFNSPEKRNTSAKANSLCFTPTKLSTMFEDSMRDWGSQDEVLADVFKADSPGKRTSRVISEGSEMVPKKVNTGGFSRPVA